MSFPHKLSISSQSGLIADAIFRAVIAFDTNDYSLLESAMDKEAIFEVNGTIYDNLSSIKNVFNVVGPMDTTHMVSNIRVHHKEGDLKAYLTANGVTSHWAPGTGNTPDAPNYTAGAMFFVDLVLDEDLWKVSKWVVKTIWRQGDVSLIKRS